MATIRDRARALGLRVERHVHPRLSKPFWTIGRADGTDPDHTPIVCRSLREVRRALGRPNGGTDA